MNIFLMVLVMMFMGIYYMMSGSAMRVTEQETTYAVTQSDMRAIAECAAAAHNASINGTEFIDICTEQNEIVSEFVCMNNKLNITNCDIVKNKKPEYSYIVTATAPLPESKYNNMLEILESHYGDAGTFGLLIDNVIVAGGTSSKRTVPKAIIEKMQLQPGQLIYLTQYEIPDTGTEFDNPMTADIICPAGTIKTYRFGRWQCLGYNLKTNCGGDKIWDSDLLECVPDESRKPLCAQQQTAVIVDDVWECINPFPEKSCPENMVARLNYSTLEWECISDPASTPDTKKCANITAGAIYGAIGTTLRVPNSSCTDCEQMITNTETCISYCIPDPSKINNPKCYPGDARACTGTSRAFYFGFPSYTYATNVDAVDEYRVPIDRAHSQNRKFNCMDCGSRGIDETKSFPPYIVICNP